MKVILATGDLSPASGGVSASVPGLVRALAACDHVTPKVLGTLDPSAPEAAARWGPEVHVVRQYGPHAFHWAPTMARVLARLAPDVVDVQGLWMHLSRVNLRHHRRHGTPYVITPRGMLDPWSLQRSRWRKRLVAAWYENAHLARAACLRATAPMELTHFRAHGLRNPVAVVPNGVDVPAGPPRDPCPSGRRRVLFLSRLHPKKGLPFLLRAWAEVAPRHAAWELVVAGPDEVGHRAEMQRLAAELGLAQLTWHEPVAGPARDELYRSADLFVLPTHAENFGLVVAEALAHRVPVVTTRHAPWEGLETHGCGWWIDLAHGPLVEAMDNAMRLDDAARAAMGARGRAWMQRDFAWGAVAGQMVEVYRWVVGGGAPPACVVTD